MNILPLANGTSFELSQTAILSFVLLEARVTLSVELLDSGT